MGFGTELQGRSSHDALLRLQDTEIRLLESIKKFVTHRIKCDRDYAQALAQVVITAQKFDANEFETPVIKTWQTILQETETLVKVIQENANTLVTRTLERLVDLINEKKVQRKNLADDRNQLDNDFNKLKDELGKQKSEYEKSMSKMGQDRSKYEDLHAKGKFNNKYEDSKNKYSKSTMKLHRVHNDYQMSLYEVILHQKQYKHSTLPGLLTFQQEMMETQVEQCKDILLSYANQTDTSKEEFALCHSNMNKCVRDVNSQAEYDDFLCKHRSDPIEAEKFEFNENLLSSYEGPLKPDQIAADTLTVDALKSSQGQYESQISIHTNKMETLKTEIDRTNTEITSLGPLHSLDDDAKHQYNTYIKQSKTLTKDFTITDTTVEKLTALLGYVKTPLDGLGDGKPPDAITFLLSGDAVPERDEQTADPENPDSQGGSGGFHKTISNMKSHLQGLKMKGRVAGGPPKPPNKDFLEPDKSAENDECSSRENGKMVKELVSKLEVDKKKGSPGKQDGYQQRKSQPTKNLKDEEWFHGILPREDVQRLLRNDGDYLLRESTNRKTSETQFVLSVYWKGHKHFIVQGKEGAWRFEGDTFPTVQELVQYQVDTGNPVTKKSESILVKAILREEWELNNEDVESGMKIGNGNFGEVFKGYYRKKKKVPTATLR